MTNDKDPWQVQVELMLPHQVEAAIAARSVVYLPLGSIEYHSHHLPLGLDGLTAHGICTRAAAASGGVVLPTLWFGTGGLDELPIDPPGQHGSWNHRHTPGHPSWDPTPEPPTCTRTSASSTR